MHFLLTGGAGYIGSLLVPSLLHDRHRVTVLDTFSSGEPNLATAKHLNRYGVTPVTCA
jgi:nucleoside-diphosphate-sugar epimerase